MRLLTTALLALLLLSCTNQGAPLELSAVQTEGYWVLVSDIPHGADDCRLTFASSGGVLVVRMLDPFACSKPNPNLTEYELLHRDESADVTRFTHSGLTNNFDERVVQRFLPSYRVFSVRRLSEDDPDATVTLIPRISPAGCYFGHFNECIGEH